MIHCSHIHVVNYLCNYNYYWFSCLYFSLSRTFPPSGKSRPTTSSCLWRLPTCWCRCWWCRLVPSSWSTSTGSMARPSAWSGPRWTSCWPPRPYCTCAALPWTGERLCCLVRRFYLAWQIYFPLPLLEVDTVWYWPSGVNAHLILYTGPLLHCTIKVRDLDLCGQYIPLYVWVYALCGGSAVVAGLFYVAFLRVNDALTVEKFAGSVLRKTLCSCHTQWTKSLKLQQLPTWCQQHTHYQIHASWNCSYIQHVYA